MSRVVQGGVSEAEWYHRLSTSVRALQWNADRRFRLARLREGGDGDFRKRDVWLKAYYQFPLFFYVD